MKSNYSEIRPANKTFKKLYISIMLFVVGRAIQAAARYDRELRKEFEKFQSDILMSLSVMPNGPEMLIGKDGRGRAKYMGWTSKGKNVTHHLLIKNIEAAMLVFTFRESTVRAMVNNRFITKGDLPSALAFIRIIDITEVYLLPKTIAKLAVKRYPDRATMPPLKKYFGRMIIYFRILIGI